MAVAHPLPAGGLRARLRIGSRSPLPLSLATSLAIVGLNALTGVVIARFFGPQGRGELTAVLLWPTLLASLGFLGLGEAATYRAARASSPLGSLAGTTAVMGAIQSALLVAVGVAVLPFALAGYGSEVRATAFVFLLYVPLFYLMNYPLSLLQGLQRFRSFNALRLLAFLPVAAGIGALALAGALSVWTAVLVYLCAYLLNGLVAAALLSRADTSRPLRPRFERGLARGLLGFGLRSHTSGVAATLNDLLGPLVISLFLAPARLGLYVVALALTSLVTLVGWSVTLVALPAVARLGPGSAQAAAVARYVRLTLLGAGAVAAPLVVFAPWLVRLVFGDAFAGAAQVSRILLAAAVVLTTNHVLQAVLKGLGRPLEAGAGEALALGATFAGLALLLPWLGLAGAALTALSAYLVSSLWLATRVGHAVGLNPVRIFLAVPGRTALS
jgi:O-antigen/teichoic acid export membrane protein